MSGGLDLGAGRSAEVYGVVGHPLTTTWSPRLHNAAFRHLGIRAVYLPLPLSPDRFEDELTRLGEAGVKGVNVTTPFKERAAAWVGDIDPKAAAIRSVNTIAWGAGAVRGTTTDGDGFRRDVDERGWTLEGTRVWCLGGGGAARAVVDALHAAKVGRIELFARRPEDVSLGGVATRGWGEMAAADPPDLILNATPAGRDSADEIPIPWAALSPGCRLYDLGYADTLSAWLRAGRDRGLEVSDGRGMLVHQAAASFSWWTGEPAPRDVMWRAIGGRR